MTHPGREAKGLVYLVGAGPGDPGLLTCRGRECLEKAEVLIYDGLAPIELLAYTPEGCEHIYAGKRHSAHGRPYSQEGINQLLVERAAAGQTVVRLKGGDPFVFGRGAEECMALADAGLAFEVVPGVSSATAVAAYAGIPLTARNIAASAVLVTGHEAAEKNGGRVNWQAVAGHQSIALFMAWKQIDDCVEKLIRAGMAPTTLAAAIRWGTRAGQRTVKTTLAELPDIMHQDFMRPPILVVIGEVVGASDKLAWFEKRPLFGKRVLLARSPERARGVCSALREMGADVLVAPTTQIEIASGDELVSLGELLVGGEWDWLMLSSANGVRACQEALVTRGVDSRALASGRIAAVGRATQAALGEMGLTPDLIPDLTPDLVPCESHGIGLAQGLLALLEKGSATRILYPRAHQGREDAV
ncbi:MAG: uroporphyrinogen-III C-methyltransferase, partial [Myxococcales bacterium]|nr:uroporphyrinogen-III C-methyltransferase [Myxococcales bacterium]